MAQTIKNIGILLTAILFLINLLAYFAPFHYTLELFTHFRFQYLWLFALSALFFLIFKNKKWFAIALLGMVVNAIPVYLVAYASQATTSYATTTTKNHTNKTSLLLSNVLSNNRKYHLLLDEIKQRQPDLIVILELNPSWAKALTALDQDYPFQKVIPRNDNFGIAIYSKVTLKNIEVKDFAQNHIPSISATANFSGQALQIIATHPLPPMNSEMAAQQELHLDNLAGFIRSTHNQTTLLAGDFNSTPYSPRYKKLTKKTGLINTRQGHGLIPSWPSGLSFSALQIPLDHVLVSKNIRTLKIERLKMIGSDHYPIWVEFAF